MSSTDQDYKNAAEYLQTQTRLQGYGAVAVGDGTVAMFSAATLKRLLDAAEASPDKEAVIFFKHTHKKDMN